VKGDTILTKNRP